MKANFENQHAEMREMLDRLRSYKNLTFRSEEVPVLLSGFLRCFYEHFKVERNALSSVFETTEERAAYDAHYLTVLEDISEIQFSLIRNQDMPVSTVLPRMEGWIASHEHLHSHLRLPAR